MRAAVLLPAIVIRSFLVRLEKGNEDDLYNRDAGRHSGAVERRCGHHGFHDLDELPEECLRPGAVHDDDQHRKRLRSRKPEADEPGGRAPISGRERGAHSQMGRVLQADRLCRRHGHHAFALCPRRLRPRPQRRRCRWQRCGDRARRGTRCVTRFCRTRSPCARRPGGSRLRCHRCGSACRMFPIS